MNAAGPLAYTRHPLNWRLALLVGSLHAEAHTLQTYGEAYRRYQDEVPFLVPAP